MVFTQCCSVASSHPPRATDGAGVAETLAVWPCLAAREVHHYDGVDPGRYGRTLNSTEMN